MILRPDIRIDGWLSVAISLLLLPLLACPSAAEPAGQTLGSAAQRFAPPVVVDFWRTHGPSAVATNDPSENAPGEFSTKSRFTHVASSAGASPAEVRLLERRLDVALKALMSQPSLADPHGVSVLPAININRANADQGTGALSATLTLIVRPINLGDKATIKLKSGRYYTPGEGAAIEIVLNPVGFLRGRDTIAVRSFGATTIINAGSDTAFIVASQPLATNWDSEALARRWEKDSGWTVAAPTATDHAMLVYLGASRQNNEHLYQGRISPTSGVARLAAAMFMVDWEEVRRQMIAIR